MSFLNKKIYSKQSAIKNNKNSLLPSGFYDLLFLEAKKNHENINKILELFFKKDFNLINTSLLEFEENFSNDSNYNISAKQYFRSIDNISAKSLILRSDITLQIRRLLATRLQNSPLPLKLCYVGDVFRVYNEELYADRQQTQIGCEIIGDESENADFIIIETTLNALKEVNLNSLIINFSLPDFIEIFLNHLQLDLISKDELKKKILEKNLSAIKNLVPQFYSLIKQIIFNNQDLYSISNVIENHFSSIEINKQLDKIKKILHFVNEKFNFCTATFSFFGEENLSQYHNNLAFEVFYKNYSYPLAIAGRYRITTPNKIFESVGSTIYMNHLRKINLD